MKKNKPSKKKFNSKKSKTTSKTKQKESNQPIYDKELFQKEFERIEKSTNFLNSFIDSPRFIFSFFVESKKDISIPDELSNPFGILADTPNPFLCFKPYDWERGIIFTEIIRRVFSYAVHCVNPDAWFGTREQVKENLKALKSEIKDIETLLTELIPRDATKKKEAQFLRICRALPKLLVKIIDEILRPKIRKYLSPPYRGKRGEKMEDIKRFWETEYKTPFPKRIFIDDRTETNIVLSILAYQAFCNYTKLTDIYYTARKQEKQAKQPV